MVLLRKAATTPTEGGDVGQWCWRWTRDQFAGGSNPGQNSSFKTKKQTKTNKTKNSRKRGKVKNEPKINTKAKSSLVPHRTLEERQQCFLKKEAFTFNILRICPGTVGLFRWALCPKLRPESLSWHTEDGITPLFLCVRQIVWNVFINFLLSSITTNFLSSIPLFVAIFCCFLAIFCCKNVNICRCLFIGVVLFRFVP